MGRALHTNYFAHFRCDSLKVCICVIVYLFTTQFQVAVVKNDWLARRLGGELFAVIFKYETVC
jgi:hypothetical protein